MYNVHLYITNHNAFVNYITFSNMPDIQSSKFTFDNKFEIYTVLLTYIN